MELQVTSRNDKEEYFHPPFDSFTRTIKIKKVDFVKGDKNKMELKLVADFNYKHGQHARIFSITPYRKEYNLLENEHQQLGYVLTSLYVGAKYSGNDVGQVDLNFE